MAWHDHLLCGFERGAGLTVSLQQGSLLEALQAVHSELGLAELARLWHALHQTLPHLAPELQDGLMSAYGLRPDERLRQTLTVLLQTPPVFQAWWTLKSSGRATCRP